MNYITNNTHVLRTFLTTLRAIFNFDMSPQKYFFTDYFALIRGLFCSFYQPSKENLKADFMILLFMIKIL